MKSRYLLALLLAASATALRADPPPPGVDAHPGWKTYRNAKYGFEFRYPPELAVRENFKLDNKTVFSPKVNGAVFAVGLTEKGKYGGLTVLVSKKPGLFYWSRTLPGFYKYEPKINAWLGYNPVAAEYGRQAETYFYLGVPLCAQSDVVGPNQLPAYGTTHRVGKGEPHNDILLSTGAYAFEIPRESGEGPVNEEILDQIRDTFVFLPAVKPLSADCSGAALGAEGLKLPALIAPKDGQKVKQGRLLTVAFDQKMPPGYGAVFYFTNTPVVDAEKIAFETAAGDLPIGDKRTLRPGDIAPAPSMTSSTPPVVLQVYLYKKVSGRKVLLGNDHAVGVNLAVE